jgi:hypothetical protein
MTAVIIIVLAVLSLTLIWLRGDDSDTWVDEDGKRWPR